MVKAQFLELNTTPLNPIQEQQFRNLLMKDELKGSTKLIGNYDRKYYYGEFKVMGTFKYSPLPTDAQVSPINGMASR